MKEKDIETYTPARLLIDGQTLTQQDFEQAIDDVIAELDTTDNRDAVDNAITTMVGLNTVSKFGLSKLMYYYSKWWERTEQSVIHGDTFDDYISSTHGLDPTVMKRYASVWHKRDTGAFPKEIWDRPIKDQQEIASTLDQGYEITEEQWQAIIDAPTGNSGSAIIRNVTREAKNKPPSKSAYVPYLERSGDIVVWHLEEPYNVGHLKNPKLATNPIERKVLDKIWTRAISGMGLIEK